MTKPTAEEALEWLSSKNYSLELIELDYYGAAKEGDDHVLKVFKDRSMKVTYGPTPLEAIRNAMKGESE